MPKGFSAREKERIRGSLLEQGKACFATYGVKKTTVEDLTKAVGISKGAFYLFYSSKEELFFEILALFEDDYHTTLLKTAIQPDISPRQQVKNFLKQAFTIWRTHPLFTHLNQEEYDYLLRTLPEDKIQLNLRKDDVFIGQLLGQWREHQLIIDCDPNMFLGLMRALFFISLHKHDLGSDMYADVIDFFIELIAQRLVRE